MTKAEKIRKLAEEELKGAGIDVPTIRAKRDGMDWVFYADTIDGEMPLDGRTAKELAFDLVNNLEYQDKI